MKNNLISFLTEIKIIVTAIRIVAFYKHQQNGYFTTEFFVRNFLRNGFQYNKTSLLFKIFMLLNVLQTIFIINFLRNEKQLYWFSYFNQEYCHCRQDCSFLHTPRKWSFYMQTIFVINFLRNKKQFYKFSY